MTNSSPAKGGAGTGPIDEGLFVDINGFEQWVTVRGTDRRNPVLLWLHGGPGIAMSRQAPLFFDWEKRFTIVQWDQPGGGSTAVKNGADTGELTIERYVQDAIAVAEWTAAHLGKDKLAVMGISWGTMLGLELAHRRPDLLFAYIGTGQIVSGPRGSLLSYQLALEDVRARGDEAAIAELEQAGPPPHATFESYIAKQKYVNPPGQKPSAAEATAIAATGQLLSAPAPAGARYLGPTLPVAESIELFLATQRAMFGQTAEWDSASLGRRFEVPMFFFQGADDHNTPTALVREYAAWIEAPAKILVEIPDAGHLTVVFHDKLLALLEENVLPLVPAACEAAAPDRKNLP